MRPESRRYPEDASVPVVVRAAAAGDEMAWKWVVRRFQGAVRNTLGGMGLSASDIADASQVTWLQLHRNLGSLRDPCRLRAWLVTTARHEALRIIRRRQSETLVDDEATFEQEPDETTAGDSALLRAEQAETVDAALDALSPRCQTLLRRLVADGDASYAELATALDMPMGSIGPTRARCLDCLRRQPQIASLLAS